MRGQNMVNRGTDDNFNDIFEPVSSCLLVIYKKTHAFRQNGILDIKLLHGLVMGLHSGKTY